MQSQILERVTPHMALLSAATFVMLRRVGRMKCHVLGFGKLIGTMVRGSGKAGRIGGEQFCIAVWDCDNDLAQRMAERLSRVFAGLQHSDLNDRIRLTASFGVATAREGETYMRLFARADEALYQAKSAGRDRVENAECEQCRLDEPRPDPNSKPVELQRAAGYR